MTNIPKDVRSQLARLGLVDDQVARLITDERNDNFCFGVLDIGGNERLFERPILLPQNQLQEGFKEKKAAFVAAGADPADVDELFRQFKALKQRRALPPEELDIDTYATVDEVREVVQRRSQEKSKSQVDREKKYEGAIKIAETPEWLVLVPKNRDASCLYGSGTKWCISGHGNSQFAHYRSQLWKHYFLLSKTRKLGDPYYKMAVSAMPDGRFDIRDAEDRDLDVSTLERLAGDLMPLFKTFDEDDASLQPLETWELMKRKGVPFMERVRKASRDAWQELGKKTHLVMPRRKLLLSNKPDATDEEIAKDWADYWDLLRKQVLAKYDQQDKQKIDPEFEKVIRRLQSTVESKQSTHRAAANALLEQLLA